MQLPKPFCVIIIVFWYFVDLVECMQFYRVYFQQRRVHSLPPLFTLSIIRCCVGCFKSVRFIIRIFFVFSLATFGLLVSGCLFSSRIIGFKFSKNKWKNGIKSYMTVRPHTATVAMHWTRFLILILSLSFLEVSLLKWDSEVHKPIVKAPISTLICWNLIWFFCFGETDEKKTCSRHCSHVSRMCKTSGFSQNALRLLFILINHDLKT